MALFPLLSPSYSVLPDVQCNFVFLEEDVDVHVQFMCQYK